MNFSFISNWWNANKKEECFICYDIDGKTEQEILFEMMFNQKHMNYPMVSLSDAYSCNCKTSFAHNRCLLNVKKCPTCRKQITKPNIYVKTRYDFWLKYLFDWVKKDYSRIGKIKYFSAFSLIFCCFILHCLSKNYFGTPKPKSLESTIIAIVIGTIWTSGTYSIIVNDYFKKYWLYDEKTHKCHAL